MLRKLVFIDGKFDYKTIFKSKAKESKIKRKIFAYLKNFIQQ